MLKEKLAQYTVVLATGSPRRQQFFRDLDIPFRIELREIDEVYPLALKGVQITDYLADLKSKAFKTIKDKELLITSDTIVWCDEEALGKPKTSREAHEMLRKLSGKKHEVMTSVSIKSLHFQRLINDTTEVYFKNLTDAEIAYYVDTYQPFDKAGSYGIQEWIGFIGIEKIKGSYFNVMGLPVHKLYKELMKL